MELRWKSEYKICTGDQCGPLTEFRFKFSGGDRKKLIFSAGWHSSFNTQFQPLPGGKSIGAAEYSINFHPLSSSKCFWNGSNRVLIASYKVKVYMRHAIMGLERPSETALGQHWGRISSARVEHRKHLTRSRLDWFGPQTCDRTRCQLSQHRRKNTPGSIRWKLIHRPGSVQIYQACIILGESALICRHVTHPLWPDRSALIRLVLFIGA